MCRTLPYNLHSSFVGTVPQAPGKKDAPASIDTKRQIFVNKCPKDWTHLSLNEHFEHCGEIISAKISITANFESRGYGFIEFKTIEGAKKAVEEMNGKEFALSGGSDAPSGAKSSSASDENDSQQQISSSAPENKVAIEV